MPRKKKQPIQLDTTREGALQLIDAVTAFPDVRWDGSRWVGAPEPKAGDLFIMRVWIKADDESDEDASDGFVHAHAAALVREGRREGERTFPFFWPPLPHLVPGVDPQEVMEALETLQDLLDRQGVESETALPQEHGAPFMQDVFTIFSAPHSQAVIQSIQAASNGNLEEWQRSEDRPPHYEDAGIVVSMGTQWPIEWPKEQVAATIAESWERVLSLDDDKVSALLICFGKWFAETGGGKPGLKVRIHVNDILSFRGRKKHHKGGFDRKQKIAARDDILALRAIQVKSAQTVYEGKGAKRREKVVLVDGPFLEVATESDVDLFGEETPYAFRISPGEWSTPYLGDDRQTAELLQAVMTLDPRQGVGRVAMRIGIYLAPQWRIRAKSANWSQPWKVRTLLEGSRVPIPTDSKLYARTQDYLDEALASLTEIGAIQGWQYRDWNEEARPRGWFAQWLETNIIITPPPSVVARYKGISDHRRAKLPVRKA